MPITAQAKYQLAIQRYGREYFRRKMQESRQRKPATEGKEPVKFKLTAEIVRVIRRDYIPYHSQQGASAMARQFGVRKQTVLDIIHRNIWKHVL